MRYVITPSLTLMVAGLLALPTLAQPPEVKDKGGDRPGSREEVREHLKARLLNAFDKDGDGKLSDEERAQMPEAARERSKAVLGGDGEGKGGKGDAKQKGGQKDGKKDTDRKRDKPRPDGERRNEGRRGPQMRGGPGRPDGEMRKVMADALFKRFDADSDDKLSREEFNKLGQFIHEHHGRGGPHGGPGMRERGPDGPRGGGEGFGPRGRDFDGPPRGDRPPRGDGPPDFERRAPRPDGDAPRRFEGGDRRPDRDGPRRPDGDGPRRRPRPDRPQGPPPGPEAEADDAV